MTSERTLKKWRKESLSALKQIRSYDTLTVDLIQLETAHLRILQLTQELMDQHLLEDK